MSGGFGETGCNQLDLEKGLEGLMKLVISSFSHVEMSGTFGETGCN